MMKIGTFILASAYATGVLINPPQFGACRPNIVPLRSTRADVERKYGPPMDDLKSLYDTDGARILVFYQKERCADGGAKSQATRRGWDVPIDTVLFFRVSPKSRISLRELGVDETKYQKFVSPLDATTYYNDEAAGISIAVGSTERWVKEITYSPTSKDGHLRCRDR